MKIKVVLNSYFYDYLLLFFTLMGINACVKGNPHREGFKCVFWNSQGETIWIYARNLSNTTTNAT